MNQIKTPPPPQDYVQVNNDRVKFVTNLLELGISLDPVLYCFDYNCAKFQLSSFKIKGAINF